MEEPEEPDTEEASATTAHPSGVGAGMGEGAGPRAGAGLPPAGRQVMLEIQLCEHGTFGGDMMRKFITMAYRADAGTGHCTCPAALDPLDSILRQPLKRSLPHLALAIRVGVIGHGIGGKVIPAKMAQLAESQLLE